MSDQFRQVRRNVNASRRARLSAGHEYPSDESPFWRYAAHHRPPLPGDWSIDAATTYTRTALKRKDCAAVMVGIQHLKKIQRDATAGEASKRALKVQRALQGLEVKNEKVCVRPQAKARKNAPVFHSPPPYRGVPLYATGRFRKRGW